MLEDDQLLVTLYAGVTRDDAFSQMLALLAHRYDCPSAVLLYMDEGRPEADIAVCFGPLEDPAVRERYETRYAALDPAPGAMAALRLGAVATTHRLFSPEDRERSRFFQDFYRPLGLEEALGGPITAGHGRLGIVAVHRGPDRPPFSEAEMLSLERLVPHLARAIELRTAFFQLESRVATLQAAVEPVSVGVMIFDRDGALTHANTAARAILARADGLSIDRHGRLLIADGPSRAALEKILAGPGIGGPVILRAGRSGAVAPSVFGSRRWSAAAARSTEHLGS